MTSERAKGYRLVLRLLEALGPAKLHPDEQAAIRDAADALLFATDIAADAEARAALDHLNDVLDELVDSERFMRETADGLLEAVEACGPQPIAA